MVRRSYTLNVAITIDLELIQWWSNLRRVGIIMVRPPGDGVAADVGVGYPHGLDGTADFPLFFVESEARLHRVSLVDVVPKLGWQKSLQRNK